LKYNFAVLALYGSEWLASRPCRFTTRNISPIPNAWVPEPVFVLWRAEHGGPTHNLVTIPTELSHKKIDAVLILRFFIAVAMKTSVLWYVTPCRRIEVHQYDGGTLE
jgi:hypothetical protein